MHPGSQLRLSWSGRVRASGRRVQQEPADFLDGNGGINEKPRTQEVYSIPVCKAQGAWVCPDVNT